MEKIEVSNWRDVKARARGRTDPGRVAAIQHEQLTNVRTHRLGELRKAQSLTQVDLANAMNVAQSRVSAIENGHLDRTELGTISAYVEALGGTLRVVADFGDQTITVE